jgi:hypothetical protein
VRRHAKAPSAGSTEGSGNSRGLLRRAFAARGASIDVRGSGAPSQRRLPLAVLCALALFASLAFASSASAAPEVLEPPTVSEVSYDSARLEGKINPGGGVSYRFEFCLDGADCSASGAWIYTDSAIATGPSPLTVKADQVGLKGGTKYFVRLTVEDFIFGEIDRSDPPNPSFTTLVSSPPSIPGAVAASSVFSTTATATAKVKRPTASNDVKCHFEYISDDQYKANEVASAPLFEGATAADCAQNPIGKADAETDKDVTAPLAGLSPATTYHLRLVAENAAASSPVVKVGANFTTAAKVAEPKVLTANNATDVSYRSAKVSGSVERPAGADPALDITRCAFEYVTDAQFQATGFDGAGQTACDQTSFSGPTSVTADLKGLKSGVEYHLRLAAENSSGTATKEAASTFTTTPGGDPTITLDPPIPGYTKVRINGTASRGLGFKDSELVVVYESAEAGTGNFSGGNFKYLPMGPGPHAFSFDFTGLNENTEYEFRVQMEERDGLGGAQVFSPNRVTTTGHLEAPTATIDPVTIFTDSTAHFSGTVDTHAPAGPLNALEKEGTKVDWHFECTPECPGPGDEPLSGTVQGEEGSKAISIDADRLEPNAHYEVKLVAGNEAFSVETPVASFNTPKVPPTVKPVTGASDGKGGYTLQGLVNPKNQTITGCEFKWGPNAPAYAFSAPCSPLPAGVDEKQRVTVSAVSGQFRLSFEGQTTGDIPFDAAASVVQAQLESLSSVGPSGIGAVTRDFQIDVFGPRYIYDITFSGPLANKNLPQLEAENGTEPAGTVSSLTLVRGSANLPITVEAHLTSLNPGVTYHALLVVTYGAGSKADGGDQEFVVTLADKENCPNEQARKENSSLALPECRAYELVSPPAKEGFGASFGEFSPGGLVRYATDAGNIAKSGQNFAIGNTYVAARSATGWETIPNLNGSSGTLRDAPSYFTTEASPFKFSEDLRSSLWAGNRKDGIPGINQYLRRPDGTFTLIGHINPIISIEDIGGTYAGASRDLSHVFYQSTFVGGPTPWGPGVYEYVGTGNEQPPRRADVDNSGKPLTECDFPASGPQEYKAKAAFNSDDGRVYGFLVAGGCGLSNPPETELWARVNGTTSFDVSASQCSRVDCNAPATPGYMGSARDGSRIFFTTTQQLVNGDTDQTKDLYSCDIPAGNPAPNAGKANHCAPLKQVSAGPTDAIVETVSSVSDGGNTVSFTAKGVLADNEDALGKEAVPGAHNLYVWRQNAANPDGQTAFAGRLNFDDLTLEDRAPQSTPDGRYLVFVTATQLVDTDTDAALDVYRYDAETGEMLRVSTNIFGVAGNGNDFGAGVSPSAVTDDGQKIVFSSGEALSPVDGNGAGDIYLWTPTRGSLISTGAVGGGAGGGFINGSGQDIFFQATGYTPADVDDVGDVYDARVGGGFSFAQPTSCSGEACQGGAVSRPPSSPPLASEGASSGNPAPQQVKKCPKGKVKKRGKCVKKPKKHKAKKHGGKKASHKKGGGK